MADHYLPLSLLSKRWYYASRDLRILTLHATFNVFQLGLPSILAQFPILQTLKLVPDKVRPELLHQTAKNFQGHPTLKCIDCPSDMITYAVVSSNCPSLVKLKVLGMKVNYDNADMTERMEEDDHALLLYPDEVGYRSRLNLCNILRGGLALEHIELQNPTFWRRASTVS